MTNEKVKSAKAEAEGVTRSAKDGGGHRPGTSAGKVCKECGEPTIPKGSARKFCDRCRDARAARKAVEVRQKQKDSKSIASYRYSGETTPTKAEAKEILTERGLSQHLVDVCYDLAIYAAEQTGLIANRFFFANGVIKTQESYAAGKPVELKHIPSDEVPGELSNLAELSASTTSLSPCRGYRRLVPIVGGVPALASPVQDGRIRTHQAARHGLRGCAKGNGRNSSRGSRPISSPTIRKRTCVTGWIRSAQ